MMSNFHLCSAVSFPEQSVNETSTSVGPFDCKLNDCWLQLKRWPAAEWSKHLDQLKYLPPIKRRTLTAPTKQRLGYIRIRVGFSNGNGSLPWS